MNRIDPKPLGFVLRHGWSFQADALRNLADCLHPLSEHILLDDLGYWSDAPTIHERDPRIAWIAIGHSYGFASLMQDPENMWHASIGIGSFTHFPQAGLSEMRVAMQRDPLAAVRAFRRRSACLPKDRLPELHAAGTTRMQDDLAALETLRFDLPDLPLLFLHGARDRIVAAPSEAVVHAQAGHELGLSEAAWCRTEIAAFLESMS
jgi:hypothetical protein